jgi:hypothetical protein
MRRIRLLGFVVLAGACGRAGDGGGTAATRDSAGIAIVENSRAAWASGGAWRLADSPGLDISADLDSVAGLVPLSAGRLAVAVAGSHQIRIYDSTGALVHTSGRTGSGPGEYQMLGGIWAGPGDSILVSDILVRRLSVIDPNGAYQRSFSFGGMSGSLVPTNGKVELAFPLGWLTDGSIAGMTMTFAINQKREGKYRDSVLAVRYAPNGTVRDTLARYPGTEMEQISMTMGAQSFSAPDVVPLGRASIGVAAGNRFYLAQNNAWEVEVRDLGGRVRRLIRLSRHPVQITEEHIAAHRKARVEQLEAIPMLKNLPAVKAQMQTRIDQAKYPATFPFIAGLIVDPKGDLWVEEVQAPGVETSVFTVLDSEGVLLGQVTMPERFRAVAVGTDVVYGVWRDQDDVPHIRGYPLRKGS